MRNISIFPLILAVSLSAYGYTNGPPNAYTGSPPQNRTCTQCHNSYPVNSGDGNLRLIGLPPDGFIPLQIYNLAIVLSDPGQSKWGFELAAIYQSGIYYLQAGTLIVTQPLYTQIGTSSGRSYLKQNTAGTYSGTAGPAVWRFQWTAPADSVTRLTFYLTGNAANYDNSITGDYIYRRSYEIRQNLPLLRPPEIIVSLEDENLVLTWTEVPDAVEYHIYCSDEPYFSPESSPSAIVPASDLSWSDTGAVNLAPRFYKIIGVSK